MPRERVTMRKIREILRLAWSCGQSRSSIAKSCGVGKTTVSDTISRALAAKLSWPLPDDLGDDTLESLLYSSPPLPTNFPASGPIGLLYRLSWLPTRI
jgi:hypothetical protein